MRDNFRCSKCGGNRIIAPQPSKKFNGNAWQTISLGAFKTAHITPFICCDCGYVEYWITDEKELKTAGKKLKKFKLKAKKKKRKQETEK